jgi:hypothetical protein
MTKYITPVALIIILSTIIVIYWFSPGLKLNEKFELSLLATSAAVVVWYTYEAEMLRAETQLQTQLSYRPLIKLQFVEPGALSQAGNLVFLIINEGSGTALNVKIKDIVSPLGGSNTATFSFPYIASIASNNGTGKIILSDIQSNDFDQDHNAKRHFLDTSNKKYSVEIEFMDIFGIARIARFNSENNSKDGFEMVLPQEVKKQ